MEIHTLSFFSLRIRLIILVLLAIVPALGIIFYDAIELRRHEVAQAQAEALTLSRLAARQQEESIEGVRQVLLSLAQLPELNSNDSETCIPHLTNLLNEYKEYNNFIVSRDDGEVFCTTMPLTQTINVKSQPWFQNAIASKAFSVGEYQLERNGDPILVFSYPILNSSNEPQAVVAASLELARLNQVAAESNLSEGTTLTIIDRNGTVLVRHPQPETWVGQTVPEAPLVSTIFDKRESQAELTDLDGIPRLFAFTPLRNAVDTGLYLAIGIPKHVAFAEADQIWIRNLASLGLVIFLALAAAWIGSEWFVLRPVNSLIRAARRLRNDLSARTRLPHRGGELGQLAQAFDIMAATLERRETERRQVQKALEQQAAKLSEQARLLDLAHNMIMVRNMEGVITFWNQGAEEMHGWTKEDALGKNAWSLLKTQFPEPLAEIEAELLREEHWEGELIQTRRDGAQIVVASRWALSKNDQKQPVGTLEINTDITERKEAERRLNIQYAVSRVLAGSDTLVEAAEQVLQTICEGVKWEFGILWRIDPSANLLRSENIWQSPSTKATDFEQVSRDTRFTPGEGLVGRVWASGQSGWIPDINLDTNYRRAAEAVSGGLHAALAFPIPSGNEVVAVIECLSLKIHEPDNDLLEMLEAIGNQIGSFIERTRAKEALQIQTHRQIMVAELSQYALATGNLPNLMDKAVIHINEALKVEYSQVWELFPDHDVLRLRAGAGWPEGMMDETTVGTGSESQAGYTLSINKPVIIEDLRKETRFSNPDLFQNFGLISGASVIIAGQERPFGVLGVHTRYRRRFTQDELHFLQAIANVLATAIERRRVEEALQLSRDQLSVILRGAADGIIAQDPFGRLIYANVAAARMIGYPSVEALLETPFDYVMERFEFLDEQGQPFPPDRFPGRLALEGESNPSATVRFRIKATGKERWSDIEARPVFNKRGQVEIIVNIFRDITELKQVEQTQRILAEVGRILASSFDYSTRLASVTELIVSSMADWCAVDMIETDETVRRVAAAHSDPDKIKLILELQRRYPPNWDALTGVPNVLRTGQSEYYPYISKELLKTSIQDAEHYQLLQQLGLNSEMIVPLIARGRTLGAVTFVWAETGRHYNTADLVLAEEVARRTALAVDNARLYEQAQQMNSKLEQRVKQRTSELETINAKLQDEILEHQRTQSDLTELQHRLIESREVERLHLAQELHDGPIQDLHGVSYQLAELWDALSDEASRGRLVAVQATLQRMIQVIRTMCGELRPPTLAPFGLEKAIRSHAEQFQGAHPELTIRLDLSPDEQTLPEQVRLALFRIYQQALNNVIRHADAHQVLIRLKLDSEQIILEVQDNGCGFDVPKRWVELARKGHLGLVGAAERTEAIGGTLKINSVPGKGTLIRATVPRIDGTENITNKT